MKFSDRYVLREIAGKGVLTPASVSDSSVKGESGSLQAITLSGSAFWLLKKLGNREFTLDEATDIVCGHYEVPKDTAHSDVTALIDTLRRCGALND